MTGRLDGKKIAFLMANSGVEEVELTHPWKALQDEGATTVLIAPERGTVQAFESDVEKAGTYEAELAVADADAGDYDALVLPGGTTNPDKLRLDDDAVAFVKAVAAGGKPIAAICHGPWTLIEAGVVDGKQLSSWPSLRTDVTNAGGTWLDQEATTCTHGGYTLVSSRNPGDLDAFSKAAIDAFAG